MFPLGDFVLQKDTLIITMALITPAWLDLLLLSYDYNTLTHFSGLRRQNT